MLSREAGRAADVARYLGNLSFTVLLLGDHERAAAALREGLALGWEIGDKLGVVGVLEGMAGLAGILKEDQRAGRLWGAAQAWREASGAQLADPDRALHQAHLDAACSRLGDAPWEEALAQGRAMTLERAMDYALEEKGSGG